MSKTVNSLNVGDKLYEPTIENIREYEIKEISKTQEGIRVGTTNYSYELRDSYLNAAISTKVDFKYGSGKRTLFVRIEDAQAIQKQLQIAKLKLLQGAAHNSLRVLNEFTLKYFTNEQP